MTTAATVQPSPLLAARLIDSPLGAILLEADDRGARRIAFVDRAPSASAPDEPEAPTPRAAAEHLERLEEQLRAYFEGRRREFTVPLAPAGAPFHRAVWERMRRIPFGRTLSYTELARRTGRSRAARAVGGACGANPLPIVIPCHRVLAADGGLGGFSSGLWRKKRLLEHEANAR